MKNDQTPTEGNHSANQETEVALDDASCSGSASLTEKRHKQNLQNNSPLQDKGLLRLIFANEAKTRQNPIYQKTEML